MSLGWLAESTILPRRSQIIEGVSRHTMVQMRAELSRHLLQGPASAASGTAAAGAAGSSKGLAELLRNPGIDRRMRRDLEEVAESQDVEGRLKEKAALYEKLRRAAAGLGDVPATAGSDALVDFEQKAAEDSLYERARGPLRRNAMRAAGGGANRRRRVWDPDDDAESDEERAAEEGRQERQRALRAVLEETARAKLQVQELRDQRRRALKRRMDLVHERRRQREEEQRDAKRRRDASQGAGRAPSPGSDAEPREAAPEEAAELPPLW
eukprot:TRINITY_DN15592_c0_g1_i1.p1 TRINITY_DN15592_c0_g1~~TRINITY_DN15592_c0_g1_i1.p1  ORF type:complete len:268 (+),score=75.53 TRINITY_DN15592_c0_g1_i1:90-893(+)